MKSLTKTDRFILTVAALALAVFSYFLYDDSLLFPQREDSGLEKIGQVYYSTNDVRLKTAAAFTWFPAQKSDDVHLQDSVFTGDRSEAAIQLQDGTILNLKPNSLITLNMKNGQMSLDLRYGDLASKLSGKSSLTITAGEKTFELDGSGSVQINKSSGGEVGVAVIEGSAKLNSQQLDAGKKIRLNPKKETEKPVEGRIELVTADGAFYLRLNPEDPIPLEWKGRGPISDYEVHICSDKPCTQPLKRLSTREQILAMKESLKDGEYGWKVKGFDKFGREIASSESRALRLGMALPPEITTPGGDPARVEGSVKVANQNDPVLGQIELTWKPETHFKSYETQIAADPEFTQHLHAVTVEGDRITTPKFPNGLYHYRVRGTLTNDRQTAWSEAARFQIDLKAETLARPARPVLAKKVFEFDPAAEKARKPASVPKPMVNWSKVKAASAYQVQLSNTPDFKEPISYTVKSSAMTWPNYKSGQWHVRVFAVTEEGVKSLPSEPSLLNVVLGDPVLDPIPVVEIRRDEKHPTAPVVDLKPKWTEIPSASSYLLEVSPTEKFENPRTVEVKGTSASVPVEKPGSYFFRVQARSEDGKPLTGYSSVEKASYHFLSPVAAPQLMEPFDQATIFLQTTVEPLVWLEWRKADRAAAYEIELATDPAFNNKLFSARLKENRYLIKKKIPTGKLYWRVRTLETDDLISDWAKAREINILSRKNEGFVE